MYAWEKQMCVFHFSSWMNWCSFAGVKCDVEVARGQTSPLCVNLSESLNPRGKMSKFTLTVCILLPPVISGSCGFPLISKDFSAHHLTRACVVILDSKTLAVYQEMLPFPIVIIYQGHWCQFKPLTEGFFYSCSPRLPLFYTITLLVTDSISPFSFAFIYTKRRRLLHVF